MNKIHFLKIFKNIKILTAFVFPSFGDTRVSSGVHCARETCTWRNDPSSRSVVASLVIYACAACGETFRATGCSVIHEPQVPGCDDRSHPSGIRPK